MSGLHSSGALGGANAPGPDGGPTIELELPPEAIAQRFRWARQQGHASYLWPDVPVDAWRAGLRELERVASRIIAGHAGTTLEPPPGATSRALGIAAFTSGMGPLLGWWLEAGTLRAPPGVAWILGHHLAHGRSRGRRLVSELGRVLDLLEAEGLHAVVVKAAHTAAAYFPEPGVRPAADVDVVVDPRHASLAARTLERAGYVALKTQSRPWKSDWLPPGQDGVLRCIDLSHEDNPRTVELHGSADRDFFGVRRLRLGPLDARNTQPAPGIHRSARVLTQPWLTLLLAAHASEELHQLQLVRIVELAEVIRQDRLRGSLDWLELIDLIRRLDAARFVHPALDLAERLVPGTLDPAVRHELADSATPRMRRVLERIGPGTAQRLESISLDERFMWASGSIEMVRRLLHMTWPTRGESQSLLRVYAERLTRLVRGRVRLRDRGD